MKLGKFIAGVGIGAVIGMLCAPKKGSELRGELKEKSQDLYDKAQNMTKDDVESLINNTIEEIKLAIDEFDVDDFKDSSLAKLNELKDKFWKSYNGNNRALRYQFECSIREGNADLVTVEKYQENFQINAFEFKLTDIRKVIRQAEENAKLVNKSWIVIPADRKSVISDKYIGACKEKGIGILYVEDGGRWSLGLSPRYKREIPMTQQLLNLMMKGY